MSDKLMIGVEICSARGKAQMSQRVLGELVGSSAKSVGDWEQGHNLPRLDKLVRIGEALRVPAWELLRRAQCREFEGSE